MFDGGPPEMSAKGAQSCDLVVFDCDGVLVDSEVIQVPIEVAALNELGWAIDEAEMVERFLGRSAAECDLEIAEHVGAARFDELSAEIERRCRQAFETSLRPVAGVEQVLDQLDAAGVKSCVASSSRHERIELTLRLTGLLDRFEGRIFSAEDVERGKPEPDLFWLASSSLSVAPSRCAVVEDSPYGLRAAIAAGMTPFAYAGGLTPRHRLEMDGVTIFDQMSELGRLLLTQMPIR